MVVSQQQGYPQLIHFSRIFHYKPFIFGVSPSMETHPVSLAVRAGSIDRRVHLVKSAGHILMTTSATAALHMIHINGNFFWKYGWLELE